MLSELQESFQRNIPDMVRSIAQTMVESTGRANLKTLTHDIIIYYLIRVT